MIIERTNNEILIRIPDTVNIDDAQRIIDYIRYQELTSKSKATQKEADNIAAEANENWWKENKDSFLK